MPAWRPRVIRHHQRVAVSVLGLLVTGLLATLAVGWYFSSEIERGALNVSHDPPRLNLLVMAVNGSTVVLEPSGKSDLNRLWTRPGRWGLEWDGGYGQVGQIRATGAGRVERDFTPLEGAPTVGAAARIDPFAFPGDPRRAFGLPFDDVVVTGELGPLPAWFVPAAGDMWAILVHGQGASRRDSLRMLPALQGAGLNVLIISYRNDEGVNVEPGGHYHFGLTEWADLDAAAQYALDRGATALVLGGNSMGGAIIMSFLRESPRAPCVAALILEAPLLDFNATIRANAPGAVPGLLVSLAEGIAYERFGIDWGRLNYLKDAHELRVPILLFHGEDDPKVPISTSRELARLRPDLVTFVPVEGARHVQAWNLDPTAFDAAISRFLSERISAARPAR